MGHWLEIEMWRQRRGELVREAQERALAREAGRMRRAFAAVEEGRASAALQGREVAVRWGLAEDEAGIARLLELNGMPRWVAFEERFIVAERSGRIVAALGYRTAEKRMTLGLLVADPWLGERRLAVALYDGAKSLAGELCVAEVTARTTSRDSGYLRESGYRRGLDGWRWSPGRSEGEAGRRGLVASVLAALHLPARGASRG